MTEEAFTLLVWLVAELSWKLEQVAHDAEQGARHAFYNSPGL